MHLRYTWPPMDDFAALQPTLASLARGEILDEAQADHAFEIVMAGKATPAQVGALLTALRVRPGGPTVDEIVGAARAMRRHATAVPVPAGMTVIDTCGTGGDASGTFNVSTVAALIAAGAGAKVAKHGNRSVTSNSGSSQVLESLGVQLNVDGTTLVRCLEQAGLCFCFAPTHHPAMKHAIGPRRELGFRTIFNLLGPLTNPAGARRQVMGVYDPDLTEPMARVLGSLGAEHAMVVHGTFDGGGLDEITITGPTRITTWHDGKTVTTQVDPESLGLQRASIDTLRVDGVEASAALIQQVLQGATGPARDIACLNAAAALVVAGQAPDLKTGLIQAGNAIDSGQAAQVLKTLVAVTQGA